MNIKALALAALSVFAPVHAVMAAAAALVVFDLVTGIVAAKKRGESITSAGFSRTTVKICVYETAIMVGFLAENYLTGPTVPVCKIVASYIGLSEALSAIENLNEISGGSLFNALLKKLESQNVKKD